MNLYFTPTSFDSDNSNPALNNMKQSNRLDWIYLTQYDQYPQSYDHNFQNNFNSSQSHWGFTSPESNFQLPCPPCPPCPQFSQYSFSDFSSYTPFLEPPCEEKSELEKSIDANLQEAER